MVFAIHWHESVIGARVSPHPETPSHLPPHSGLSQSTGFEIPASCIDLAPVIYFTYSNIHVSMLFSQIIPFSLSPTEKGKLRDVIGIFTQSGVESAIGWMHETSAQGWCTGKTQRDGVGREAGGGIVMGSTCKSVADSCQCMAKSTTIL